MPEETKTGHRRVSAQELANWQADVDLSLVPIKQQPFNAEAPIGILDEYQTPTELFYVRSNFPLPDVSADSWHLTVDGEVDKPLTLSYAELLELPSREIAATLECAGNDRSGFTPPAEGEQWTSGALSSARWRGVELQYVLERVGLKDSAVEVLFIGSDSGQPHGEPIEIPFARSLSVEQALSPDTLLVYEMNGEPLTTAHGGPVRVLVAGWYGMAAVEWLASIDVLAEPFTGYYQKKRYVFEWPDEPEHVPVNRMLVKALATGFEVAEDSTEQVISGVTWSGSGPVLTVEISIDGGAWEEAELQDDPRPFAWRRWRFAWAKGEGKQKIRVRASDVAGNTQPDEGRWNRLGYGNNAIQEIEV